MDCVFKAWGYVPKHRFCTKCEPLELIFKSLGYDMRKRTKAVDLIFRAYTMVKADDVLRDEKNGLKTATAKLVKKLCRLRVTDELGKLVEKADRTIRDLESSPADAEEYVRQVSTIGGQLFQTSADDPKAFLIGQTLSAATTVHDMIKDLEGDKQKRLFNPLKNLPKKKIDALTADLLSSRLGDTPLLPRGLQTNIDRSIDAQSTSRTYERRILGDLRRSVYGNLLCTRSIPLLL